MPAAKASVRTMPKLSPESEGAQRTSAACSSAPQLLARRRGRGRRSSRSARDRSASAGRPPRSAPITVRRRGHVLDQRAEGGRAGSAAPCAPRGGRRRGSAAPPRAPSARCGGASTSTPLGMIVYSPPNQRRPVQAAASETAIRAERRLNMRRAPSAAGDVVGERPWSSRRGRCRRPGSPGRRATAFQPTSGASGSCTWMTSKSPRADRAARGEHVAAPGRPRGWRSRRWRRTPTVRPSGIR